MINLIPKPKNLTETAEWFSFEKKNATAFISPELSEIKEMLGIIMGFEFKEAEENATISFIFDNSESKDSYSLIVDKSGIRVFASDGEGAFYALQSVRQLFEADHPDKKCLASHHVKITNDKPKYEWRGLHLDESRHFFGKETVKKMLDFMALYKLNRFHWHLTDDQGWRIEIKKYPLLTEIGSKRKCSQIGNWKSKNFDNTPVEGFYTQEDIKEIVQYAKKRQIEIVPEIDFPAHSAALIASYNHLACRDIPCEVFPFFGGIIPESQGNKKWNRPLCLGKEEVYDFVYDIIDEVSELFPFEYFHVGGDEAPRDEWKACPHCQAKMKEENLKNEDELQGYFTNKVSEHLRSKGKIMIGWNEILKAKLINRDIVAQYWTPQRDNNVTTHLKRGGKVILSCHKAFYLDMNYAYVTAKSAYNFNPIYNNVPKNCLSGVLGLEGENWTEWIDTEELLFYKIYPRALALAENAWSDESVKNYGDFCDRLKRHNKIMDALGIYYGDERITLHRSVLYKSRMASKLGLTLKDFDAEYRISVASR